MLFFLALCGVGMVLALWVVVNRYLFELQMKNSIHPKKKERQQYY